MTSDNYNLGKALAVVTAAIILVGVLLALTTEIAGAAERGSTAADRPDWQDKNTIQNLFENYVDWVEYTNEVDEDFANTTDIDLSTDLVGEAYSVTQELLVHIETQEYPSGNCAQQFEAMTTTLLSLYSRAYGGFYYNLTTLVGEPIDTEYIFDEIAEWEDFYFADERVYPANKCWNKLDI